MAFYFSTKQIPQLTDLPLTERIRLLDKAAKKLTIPEKTILNILKLLVIVPAFALVLRTSDDWTSILWALAIFVCYPLIIKPIQYSLCAKYLPNNTEVSE